MLLRALPLLRWRSADDLARQRGDELAGERLNDLARERFDKLARQRSNALARQRLSELARQRLNDLCRQRRDQLVRQNQNHLLRPGWNRGTRADDGQTRRVLRGLRVFGNGGRGRRAHDEHQPTITKRCFHGACVYNGPRIVSQRFHSRVE